MLKVITFLVVVQSILTEHALLRLQERQWQSRRSASKKREQRCEGRYCECAKLGSQDQADVSISMLLSTTDSERLDGCRDQRSKSQALPMPVCMIKDSLWNGFKSISLSLVETHPESRSSARVSGIRFLQACSPLHEISS